MPFISGPILRTISELAVAAPVPKTYTRTIDGVARPLTIPEPSVRTFVTSSSTRNQEDK